MHDAQGPSPRELAPPAPGLLRQLAIAPDTPAWLLLAWAGLLLIATQLPQADAPLVTADGLARPDVLALRSLGLDRIFGSVLAWLLAAATLYVAVVRGLFTDEVAVWRADATVPAQALSQALAEAIARNQSGRGLAVRTRAIAGGTRLEVGRPGWTAALLATGGLLLAAHLLVTARGELPVFVDVPIGSPAGPLKAWVAEGGSLAPAPGRWAGACKAAGQALHCTLEVPGGRIDGDVLPGRLTRGDRHHLAWVSRTTAATSNQLQLDWYRPDPVSLRLPVGEVRQAGALQARLQAVTSSGAGPIVLVSQGPAAERQLSIWTTPVLAPRSRPVATVHGAEIARFQVLAPASPPWLAGAGLLLLGLALLAGGRRPQVRLDVSGERVTHVVVHSCNQADLLAVIERTVGQSSPQA